MKTIKHYCFIIFSLLLVVNSACKKDNDVNIIYSPATADKYVAGDEVNALGKYVAIVWKNAVETPLTYGSKDPVVYDITISGNDVYVCGYQQNAVVCQ